MQATILYQINQPNGTFFQYEDKANAIKVWEKIVNDLDAYYKTREDTTRPLDWVPSLKHYYHTNIDDWKVYGEFVVQFKCLKYGQDFSEEQKYTISTLVRTDTNNK